SYTTTRDTPLTPVPRPRAPSMPLLRGLAEPHARGLKHRLIGERARARHDADLAGRKNVARHDADLAFARGHHARTVRPDQPRLSARQRALDLHHVEHRNALGDADDKGDFGLDRFANRIRSASRRHVDHARVAIGLLLRLRYAVEDRQA